VAQQLSGDSIEVGRRQIGAAHARRCLHGVSSGNGYDPSRMNNPRRIRERFSGAEKIPAQEVAPLGPAAGVGRPEPAAGAARLEALIGRGRLDLESEVAKAQAVTAGQPSD
jgi:hypothetical protein